MLKRALIVFAQPSQYSYCGHLRDITMTKLDLMGYETIQSDLYKMKFDPVFNMEDLQMQKLYFEENIDNETASRVLGSDLQKELDKVLAAKYMFLIAPTWMGSFPAILKGWLDRVLSAGFAGKIPEHTYKNGYLKGKKCMIITSTGYGKDHFSKNGKNASGQTIEENYKHIINEVLAFNGIETLPIFNCYGMYDASTEQKNLYFDQLSETLDNLEDMKPIYCPLLHNP